MRMTDAQYRRARLAHWLWSVEHPVRMTATQIADASGLYSGHCRYDRCFDDLKLLARDELVERVEGRPARWQVSS